MSRRNIRLTLAYDGTGYVGWQVQPNGPSVQAALEEAIRRTTGEDVRVLAAGRTDAGVHALGQAVNFVTESSIPCAKFPLALQSHLPDDIVVRDAREVARDFHATYSAVSKRYRYVIHNSRVPNPFLRRYAWQFRGPLDAARMHEAARTLAGTHDFRSFETQFPNKASSVRTVSEIAVRRVAGWPVWVAGAGPTAGREAPETARPGLRTSSSSPGHPADDGPGAFVCLDIVADGFLYNMVRAIVGTLVKAGERKWTPEAVARVRDAGDRSQAGPTAPPHGLYLVHVDYGG